MNIKLNNVKADKFNEAKAFIMDADRLERERQREIANKNKTKEQIAKEKLADEKMADLDKVFAGTMAREDFFKKWES